MRGAAQQAHMMMILREMTQIVYLALLVTHHRIVQIGQENAIMPRRPPRRRTRTRSRRQRRRHASPAAAPAAAATDATTADAAADDPTRITEFHKIPKTMKTCITHALDMPVKLQFPAFIVLALVLYQPVVDAACPSYMDTCDWKQQSHGPPETGDYFEYMDCDCCEDNVRQLAYHSFWERNIWTCVNATEPPQDCGPGLTGVAGNCMPCSTSTYKTSTGSDACTKCPPNSRHELKAQTSVSACVCDPGYMTFDLGTCTQVEKKDTVSEYTSTTINTQKYTNSGSSKHYTDKITIVWMMLIALSVLFE